MRAQEQMAFGFAGQLVKKDDFVALDGAALRDRAALQDTVIGVVLHAGDEIDAVGIERGEPGVVGEAAIKRPMVPGSKRSVRATRLSCTRPSVTTA